MLKLSSLTEIKVNFSSPQQATQNVLHLHANSPQWAFSNFSTANRVPESVEFKWTSCKVDIIWERQEPKFCPLPQIFGVLHYTKCNLNQLISLGDKTRRADVHDLHKQTQACTKVRPWHYECLILKADINSAMRLCESKVEGTAYWSVKWRSTSKCMMRHYLNKVLLCVRVLAHAILLALQYTAEIHETVCNRTKHNNKIYQLRQYYDLPTPKYQIRRDAPDDT
jgi:hypothetical protein